MSLSENLSYVKHDLTNINEALLHYDTTKDKFPGPQIPAALIQRIATTKMKKQSLRGEVMRTKPYKAMLRRVKQNVTELDDKNLVDTLYAVGMIH